MSTQKPTSNYFHPRNIEGYWRAAIRRELERMEETHPGIFSTPPAQQQEAAHGR